MKNLVKTFVLSLFLLALVFPLSACSKNSANKDTSTKNSNLAGSYVGKAPAYHGDLGVSIELDDQGKILSLDVKEHKETEGIGTIPIEKFPSKIVETQSLDIDSISGATITGDAIIEATAKALESAKVDLSKYNYTKKTNQEEKNNIDYTIDKDTMPKKEKKTDSVTITDAKGRQVKIDLPVSSYAISTMDVIDYIIPLKGKKSFDLLVGSGQDGGHGFNKYAELYVPEVGNYLKHTGQISEHNAPFDLEMLLSMEPEVLIVNSAMGAHKYAMEIEEQLEAVGTKIVLIDVPGKEIENSVQNTMDILGKIFQEEERAKELSTFIDDQYKLIQSKNLTSLQDKPSVYYEKSGYSEVFGSTSTSKNGWGLLIDLAGGSNIADTILEESAAGKGANNTLDPEYVLKSNPDFIILSGINDGWLDRVKGKTDPSFDILNRNGWKNLDAVKNGNLYEFAHSTSRSIFSFYPTLKMAKLFYPEEFADLDPEAKLEEFFDKFMLLDPSISTWSHSIEDTK